MKLRLKEMTKAGSFFYILDKERFLTKYIGEELIRQRKLNFGSFTLGLE